MTSTCTQYLLGEVEIGIWQGLHCKKKIICHRASIPFLMLLFMTCIDKSCCFLFRHALKEIVNADLKKLLGVEGEPTFIK
jgi:hypothetical protein